MNQRLPARTTLHLRAGAVLAATCLLLTACATTTQPSAEEQTSKQPSDSASCRGDASTSTSSGPVTLTDDFGRTVKLKKPAQRVVVLEWQQIEDVLSLCLTPVGVADAKGYRLWDTAEELPSGVKDVGQRGEPNLDALFSTNPDLVVVELAGKDDPIVKRLAKYDVPVVATAGADAEDPIAKMKRTLSLLGKATGREEQATAVNDQFDTHLAAAKEKLASADLPTRDFLYFDAYVEGGNVSIRPFGQGSLMGELGEALGLDNAWTGKVDPVYGLGQTDIEGMTKVGDATLLHTGTVDDGGKASKALDTNKIWRSLPAVSEKRYRAFPSGVWTFGGPRSAEQALDAYVDLMTS